MTDLVAGGAGAVEAYRAAAINPRTQAIYAAAWGAWEAWARQRGAPALPAEPLAVEQWVVQLADAGWAVATIRLRLAVLSRAHQVAGHPSPTTAYHLRQTMRGIAKRRGTAQRQAAPLLVEHVRTAVHQVLQEPGPWALRDRAVLLVGWACGLRVSELVGLAVQDLEPDERGVVVWVRHSKVDQEGRGRGIRLARGTGRTDPVAALQEWREARAVMLGAASALSDVDHSQRTALWLAQDVGRVRLGQPMQHDAVSRLVKRCAAAQGLDPRRYSSHSLRRGLVTSLLAAGRSVVQVQALTGHRSVASVSRYADGARLLESSPAEGLGL